MTSLNIQNLVEQDFTSFVDLTLEIFGKQKRALADGTFRDALTNIPARPHILSAKLNGDIIGGVVMTPILPLSNYTTYGISWLFVVPEHRGKGYSKTLMDAAEGYIREKLLDGDGGDVLLSTAVGAAFYEKRGYKVAYVKYNKIPVLIKTIERNSTG